MYASTVDDFTRALHAVHYTLEDLHAMFCAFGALALVPTPSPKLLAATQRLAPHGNHMGDETKAAMGGADAQEVEDLVACARRWRSMFPSERWFDVSWQPDAQVLARMSHLQMIYPLYYLADLVGKCLVLHWERNSTSPVGPTGPTLDELKQFTQTLRFNAFRANEFYRNS